MRVHKKVEKGTSEWRVRRFTLVNQIKEENERKKKEKKDQKKNKKKPEN